MAPETVIAGHPATARARMLAQPWTDDRIAGQGRDLQHVDMTTGISLLTIVRQSETTSLYRSRVTLSLPHLDITTSLLFQRRVTSRHHLHLLLAIKANGRRRLLRHQSQALVANFRPGCQIPASYLPVALEAGTKTCHRLRCRHSISINISISKDGPRISNNNANGAEEMDMILDHPTVVEGVAGRYVGSCSQK
jgi:hypothetical protein